MARESGRPVGRKTATRGRGASSRYRQPNGLPQFRQPSPERNPVDKHVRVFSLDSLGKTLLSNPNQVPYSAISRGQITSSGPCHACLFNSAQGMGEIDGSLSFGAAGGIAVPNPWSLLSSDQQSTQTRRQSDSPMVRAVLNKINELLSVEFDALKHQLSSECRQIMERINDPEETTSKPIHQHGSIANGTAGFGGMQAGDDTRSERSVHAARNSPSQSSNRIVPLTPDSTPVMTSCDLVAPPDTGSDLTMSQHMQTDYGHVLQLPTGSSKPIVSGIATSGQPILGLTLSGHDGRMAHADLVTNGRRSSSGSSVTTSTMADRVNTGLVNHEESEDVKQMFVDSAMASLASPTIGVGRTYHAAVNSVGVFFPQTVVSTSLGGSPGLWNGASVLSNGTPHIPVADDKPLKNNDWQWK